MISCELLEGFEKIQEEYQRDIEKLVVKSGKRKLVDESQLSDILGEKGEGKDEKGEKKQNS